MGIHPPTIGTEEECVLFECKDQFQRKYPRYVRNILNDKHIPRKVVTIYPKMPLVHPI